MKAKTEMEATSHNSVYKKLRKMFEAPCSFCPWHKVENQKGKPERSWKRHRKEKYK